MMSQRFSRSVSTVRRWLGPLPGSPNARHTRRLRHLRKNFLVLARGNAPQYRSPACARSARRVRGDGAHKVAQPHAEFLDALDSPYSGCPVGTEQSTIRSVKRETAKRFETKVNGSGSEAAGFQMHPRCRVTTVLLNESRGPDQYQSANSLIACRCRKHR